MLRVWEMADEQWQARQLLEAQRKAVVLVAASPTWTCNRLPSFPSQITYRN